MHRRRPRRSGAPRHRSLQGRERQPRPRSRRRVARDAAASRLARVLRAGDRLARLGGDELAVVCHNVAHVDDVLALARRLRAVFDQPFSLGDDEVFLGASVGVIVSERPTTRRPACCATPTSRCSRPRSSGADASSCSTTRCATARCDGSRSRAVCGARSCAASSACTTSRSSRSPRSEMIGLEALVRWEHPELGLLEPADFLEIAEETGLIVPIGAWVLHEACSQTARWCAELPQESPLSIAVNLSARQLNDPELVSIVDSVLAATRLDPALLTLEINETVLVENRETVDRRVAAALGARRAHRHRRLRHRPVVARAPERAAGRHAEDRPVVDRGPRDAPPGSRRSSRPSSASGTRSASR